jgi:hypothetical protein
VEKFGNLSDDGFVIWLLAADIFWIKIDSDAKSVEGIKCLLAVFDGLLEVERGVVKKLWAEFVDKGAEGKTVVPGTREVLDFNAFIAGSVLLAPKKKGITGSGFFNSDFFDKEFVDHGPGETKSKTKVLIIDIFAANTDNFDVLLLCHVFDSIIAVLDSLILVLWFWIPLFAKVFFANDLKKVDEFDTIGEFAGNIFKWDLAFA